MNGGTPDPETGSSPGQSASAATVWRSLSPTARREVRRLARRLLSHPDPAVAAIAARYGQAGLARKNGRRDNVLLVLAGLALAACLAVLAGTSPDPSAGGTGTLILLLAAATATVGLEISLVLRLRRRFRARLLSRIAAANRLALPGSATGPLPGPVPAHPVTVTYSAGTTWAVISRLILAATAAVLAAGLGAAITAGLPHMLFLVLAVAGLLAGLAVAGQAFRLLARWVLPHRPVIVLDRPGVHFAAISFTLPWPELAEIRLFPVTAGRAPAHDVPSGRSASHKPWPGLASRGATLIAFVPANPAELLPSLPLNWFRRMTCKRALRLYGTPLTIADRLLDLTGEQIAGAAARYAPVIVRHYHDGASA